MLQDLRNRWTLIGPCYRFQRLLHTYSTQACVHQQLLSSYIFFTYYIKIWTGAGKSYSFYHSLQNWLTVLTMPVKCLTLHSTSVSTVASVKAPGSPHMMADGETTTHPLRAAAPLGGSKHNSNPRDGCCWFSGLLSMNLQCSIQGFPGTWPKKLLSSIALPFVHSQRSWVAINSKERDSVGFLCGVHKQNIELHNSTKIYVQGLLYFSLHITNTSIRLSQYSRNCIYSSHKHYDHDITDIMLEVG